MLGNILAFCVQDLFASFQHPSRKSTPFQLPMTACFFCIYKTTFHFWLTSEFRARIMCHTTMTTLKTLLLSRDIYCRPSYEQISRVQISEITDEICWFWNFGPQLECVKLPIWLSISAVATSWQTQMCTQFFCHLRWGSGVLLPS